jgi:hypothetical protein
LAGFAEHQLKPFVGLVEIPAAQAGMFWAYQTNEKERATIF